MGRQKTTGISHYETGTGRNSLRPFLQIYILGHDIHDIIPRPYLLDHFFRIIHVSSLPQCVFYIFHAFGTNNSQTGRSRIRRSSRQYNRRRPALSSHRGSPSSSGIPPEARPHVSDIFIERHDQLLRSSFLAFCGRIPVDMLEHPLSSRASPAPHPET